MLDVVVNHRCASLQALNDLSDCNIYQIKSPKPRQNLTNPRLKLAKSAHLIVQFVPFHDENVWNLSKRSVHGNNFAGFRRQVAEVWGQTWWVRIREADCASGGFPMKKNNTGDCRQYQVARWYEDIWYMLYIWYHLNWPRNLIFSDSCGSLQFDQEPDWEGWAVCHDSLRPSA